MAYAQCQSLILILIFNFRCFNLIEAADRRRRFRSFISFIYKGADRRRLRLFFFYSMCQGLRVVGVNLFFIF